MNLYSLRRRSKKPLLKEKLDPRLLVTNSNSEKHWVTVTASASSKSLLSYQSSIGTQRLLMYDSRKEFYLPVTAPLGEELTLAAVVGGIHGRYEFRLRKKLVQRPAQIHARQSLSY